MDIAEERKAVRDFALKQGLTFTILLDEKSSAAQLYQVRGIPSSFFIDRQGVIQARHTGPLNESVIEKYVDLIL